MIPALAVILLFQLGGEALSRGLGLPVPGPVIGMVALVAAFAATPRLAALVRPVAQGLLASASWRICRSCARRAGRCWPLWCCPPSSPSPPAR